MTKPIPGQQAPQSPAKQSAKAFFNSDHVKAKFQELLGKRSSTFLTSVLQVVASNDLLQKADPASIYHAAMVAATLDLPINNSIGQAYVVPFKDKEHLVKGQLIIGWKGYVQLALRSGQFNRISTTEVFEGQIKEANPLTGYVFDWNNKQSDKIVGYAAYFRLINGFEASYYMTIEQVLAHAKKYSQTFKKGIGVWVEDRDSMAKKTVLKLLLSKFAPLSIEMQKAVQLDQAVINDEGAEDVTYIDNTEEPVNKPLERAAILISEAESLDELENIWNSLGDDLKAELHDQMEEKYKSLEQ